MLNEKRACALIRTGTCACSLMAAKNTLRDKKKDCCKKFKHGKRCKKCPGRKK